MAFSGWSWAKGLIGYLCESLIPFHFFFTPFHLMASLYTGGAAVKKNYIYFLRLCVCALNELKRWYIDSAFDRIYHQGLAFLLTVKLDSFLEYSRKSSTGPRENRAFNHWGTLITVCPYIYNDEGEETDLRRVLTTHWSLLQSHNQLIKNIQSDFLGDQERKSRFRHWLMF